MKERFYKVMRVLLGAYYAVVFPATVEGLENIPAEGAFILCCNHCSNRDPFYLGVFIRQRFLYFMAKIELFRFWPVSWFVRSLGGFPVDRGHSDLNAVRTALKLLKDGHGLGIFPQGTRSPDNAPTPMLEGVSMIALRANAPVTSAGPIAPSGARRSASASPWTSPTSRASWTAPPWSRPPAASRTRFGR